MAITPTLVYQSLLSVAPGSGINGLSYPIIANAIANGFYTWIINSANYALLGTSVGTGPGSGSIIGTLVIPPNPGILLGNLINAGPSAPAFCNAIANGISLAFTSGITYTGNVIGVYAGVDTITSILINNPLTLGQLIYSYLLTPTAYSLCVGLGNGISQMLSIVTGVGTIIPVTTLGSLPATVVSTSFIV